MFPKLSPKSGFWYHYALLALRLASGLETSENLKQKLWTGFVIDPGPPESLLLRTANRSRETLQI